MLLVSLKRYCLGFIVLAVAMLGSAAASAQVWVGSTGTVDPNSVNLVKYIDGRVELRNDAPVGSTAFIRYNVLPVRDLTHDLFSIEYRIFSARFLDDGGGQVVLLLKQYNINTGAITTLMTFDSNLSVPGNSYQVNNTPGNPVFDFFWADSEGINPTTDSVYYVEAHLTRIAAGGHAGLAGFSIKTIIP